MALEGVKDAAFDEIVEFSINDGAEKRLGHILKYTLQTKQLFRFLRVLKVCPLQIPILS